MVLLMVIGDTRGEGMGSPWVPISCMHSPSSPPRDSMHLELIKHKQCNLPSRFTENTLLTYFLKLYLSACNYLKLYLCYCLSRYLVGSLFSWQSTLHHAYPFSNGHLARRKGKDGICVCVWVGVCEDDHTFSYAPSELRWYETFCNIHVE